MRNTVHTFPKTIGIFFMLCVGLFYVTDLATAASLKKAAAAKNTAAAKKEEAKAAAAAKKQAAKDAIAAKKDAAKNAVTAKTDDAISSIVDSDDLQPSTAAMAQIAGAQQRLSAKAQIDNNKIEAFAAAADARAEQAYQNKMQELLGPNYASDGLF